METYTDYLQPQHLRKSEIFSQLTDSELQNLVDAPENGIEDYASKENIFQESEVGECMYIILEGLVNVYLKGEFDNREVDVATLRTGEYFGENAVLSKEPVKRSASVRAYLPAKVFRMDKQRVLEAIKGHPKTRGRFPPDEVRDMIMRLPMFNSLKHEELLTIKDWASIITYKENEFVFKSFQAADYMYVILEGNVELLTLGDDGEIIVVSRYKEGNFFGETELMPGGKGKYGVYARTSTKSRIIKIPKEYFRLLLSRDSKLVDNLNTIHKIKILH